MKESSNYETKQMRKDKKAVNRTNKQPKHKATPALEQQNQVRDDLKKTKTFNLEFCQIRFTLPPPPKKI